MTDHGPRMRDLPAPRRTTSLIGPLFRWLFGWPFRAGLSILHRLGLRPWHVTLLSLAGNVTAAGLLLTGRRLVPGFVLLGAGILDLFDGALARLRGEESRRGALLDSTMDRVADAVVLGTLAWSLAGQSNRAGTALALAALGASLLVSHVRAEAEAHSLELSGGFFQRLERYVALTIGLTVPGTLLPVLGLLAALGAGTAIQRFARAWRDLGRKSDKSRPPA